MAEDIKDGLIVAGVCFGLGLFVGCYGGEKIGETIEREKALQAEVGRWVVDKKTGETSFFYGPKCSNQSP